MKKIISISLIICGLISCVTENEMRVHTTIKGLQKGTVYLQKVQDSTLITLDSIVINGVDKPFTLIATANSAEIFYLYIDKIDGIPYNDRITFFGEKGDVNISTHLDKINTKIRITGSESNTIYEAYQKIIKQINIQLAQENIKILQAQVNKNQDKILASDKKALQLIRAKYLRAIQFAMQHNKSVVAAYIGAREIPEAQIKYLDTIYNGLSKKIKKSIYGKELKGIITNRK